MTKSELVELISQKLKSLSNKEIDLVVSTLFSRMTDALSQGNRIEVRGFGTFEVRVRPSRQGRNPKTGKEVFVNTRRVPFFKVGKELREKINHASSKGQAKPPPSAKPIEPPPLAHGVR